MKLRIKVAAWLKIKKYLHFIPSYEFKLYGLIFILLGLQSYLYGGELTEEIFSVFILAYAVNLLNRKTVSSIEYRVSGIELRKNKIQNASCMGQDTNTVMSNM